MRREGVRESQRCGEPGAEERGTEDVQRHVGALAGVGVDAGDERLPAQVALELEDVLREGVGGGVRTPQRAQRVLFAARRPAEAEVDPARVEALEGAVLLGDGQR